MNLIVNFGWISYTGIETELNSACTDIWYILRLIGQQINNTLRYDLFTYKLLFSQEISMNFSF